MTHDEAFLDSIREEPDDDGLRLIYADFLEDKGDPRGEFIRVQVELARMEKDDPRREEYRQRERELLEAHRDAWMKPLRQALDAGEFVSLFRRGFVEEWTTPAGPFVDRGAEVFRLAPIRHVRLHKVRGRMEEVAGCPWLRFVESLEFIGFYADPVRADGAAALARSHHLGRLRVLNLQRNNIADQGVWALREAPWLAGLRVLNLVDNGLSAWGVEALADTHLPALTDLRLGGNWPEQGLPLLLSSPVVEQLNRLDLSGCDLSAADLTPLLESQRLRRLNHLDLGTNPLGAEGARLLAGSPLLGQLNTLYLDSCHLGDEGVEALANSPHLGTLRALFLRRNGLTGRGARALAGAGLLGRVQVEEQDDSFREELARHTRP